MYNAKIGPHPRIPTSEWAGCGFSKTHLSLFPHEGETFSSSRSGGDGLESNSNAAEEGKSSCAIAVPWPETEAVSSIIAEIASEDVSAVAPTNTKAKECIVMHQKPPLVPQQSNLLDFAASRATLIDRKATDLPSMFIENGLEKYIRNYHEPFTVPFLFEKFNF